MQHGSCARNVNKQPCTCANTRPLVTVCDYILHHSATGNNRCTSLVRAHLAPPIHCFPTDANSCNCLSPRDGTDNPGRLMPQQRHCAPAVSQSGSSIVSSICHAAQKPAHHRDAMYELYCCVSDGMQLVSSLCRVQFQHPSGLNWQLADQRQTLCS
jgi:hypothetical protein